MLDFALISIVRPKKTSDPVIFKPKFIVNPMTKDLMVKEVTSMLFGMKMLAYGQPANGP